MSYHFHRVCCLVWLPCNVSACGHFGKNIFCCLWLFGWNETIPLFSTASLKILFRRWRGPQSDCTTSEKGHESLMLNTTRHIVPGCHKKSMQTSVIHYGSLEWCRRWVKHLFQPHRATKILTGYTCQHKYIFSCDEWVNIDILSSSLRAKKNRHSAYFT